jgi:adenine specific DNA methylase Mod
MSDEVKKVNLESKNITEETLEELKRLIPSAFKEGKIDFDALKAALGDVVEPSREFYNFTWAGKSEAFRTLQRPSTATLKPCKEESKEWDKTENLFIEGDNLEVLKLLQKGYHNSIKMIYIDPPYNKDKDFVYPDRWSEGIKSYKEFCGFVDSEGNITTSVDEAKNAAGRKHSRWLTMMYPRLFLARNLLKDDGVIFVSIDDDEAANLKKIMDEIFGEENFVGQFPRVTKKAGKSSEELAINNDYIISYRKSSSGYFNSFEHNDDGFKYSDEFLEQRGMYKLNQTLDYNSIQYSPSLDYEIELDKKIFRPGNVTEAEMKERKKRNPDSDFCWRWSKDLFNFGYENGFIVVKNARIYTKTYQKATISKNANGYFVEIKQRTKPVSTLDFIDNKFSNDNSKKDLSKLFNESVFDYSKPIELIKILAHIGSDNNDLILDFFAGSGTTAHAVMALNAEDGGNRKFICVQIPEPTPQNSEAKKAGYKTIAEICKERIRRAGEKVKADNPLFAGDIGFKVFKLDESNFKQWDKEITDVESLRKSLLDFADNVADGADKTDMLYELLLKKGYSLNAKVEKKQIADNEIFVVDGSMLVCLDDKISTATIDEVIKLCPAHFIVLDRAFEGNDQLKTNTWQTFKTLFPNDENPFETV